jgi:drug/metabolite transporter (DMT)-like permease
MNQFSLFYTGSLLFFFADVLQKKTSMQQHTWMYVFNRSAFTAMIAWLACLLFEGLNSFPNWKQTGEVMCISLSCGLGFYFYIKAIHHTRFSNVGSLSIVGTVFQMLIGFFLLHEPFTMGWIPAILLMSVGAVLQLLQRQSYQGAGFVLLSVFFWTIGYAGLSRVLQQMSVIWSVPLMETTILMMSGGVLLLRKEKYDFSLLKSKGIVFKLILIGLFIFGGSYWNNLSFQQIPVSVISILQLSMMPIGYILSLRIFKEKPSRIELISFISGCAGFAWYIWMKS